MATKIYDTKIVKLIDGTPIEISPLKIKYLRRFMEEFALIKNAKNDDEAMTALLECTRICMEQHHPDISKSIEVLEDSIDLKTMHQILDICAGIKFNGNKEDALTEAKGNKSSATWEDFDLVKIELEVFMLGIWKNFDELESSLCMEEISNLLTSKRELDYEEKKFFAAIQGVDLDKNNNRGQKEWEDMKARVFSKGKATDSNDILALQGENAKKAGFGIGMGLEYQDLTKQ